MNDQHVVVMFEPAHPDENLSLTEQTDEVFGPFETGEEAEDWAKKMENYIKDREWLIIPLSNKNVINKFEVDRN